jgi:DNA polymerase III delta prime subunit
MEAKAQLIVGGRREKRIEFALKILRPLFSTPIDLEKPPIDLLIVKGTHSVGINQIRALKKFLSLKPYQAKAKAVLLLEAEKMTLAAQNSLLKTLEEPPESTWIILLAHQPDSLLTTILSRTKINRLPAQSQIQLEPEELKELQQMLKKLLTLAVGERMKMSLVLAKNKQQTLELTEKLLFLWRHLLLRKIGLEKKLAPPFDQLRLEQIEKATKNTEQIRKMLVANVNFHLAIESLFLSYPHLV